MKKTWEEGVNDDVQEISDHLVLDFQNETTLHRFSVNHVDPFGYATMPIIIDYTLFVDIEKIDKGSKKVKRFEDISLGAYFNSGPRKLIPFGEKYFDQTYDRIINIVAEQHKNQFKED